MFDLGELEHHVGVVGLAHYPLCHVEQDVVLLENVLPQQGDVFPGGIGKRAVVASALSPSAAGIDFRQVAMTE